MTFDLAQMIADREAGTPGEWTAHQGFPHIVCPVDHFTRPYGGSVDKNRDRNNYAHIIAMADHDRHGRGDNHANARRIARVPLLEAEIIRLTARVAELEALTDDIIRAGNGLAHMLLGGVAMTKPALEAFVTRHINARNAWDAAISTPTEEPKT